MYCGGAQRGGMEEVPPLLPCAFLSHFLFLLPRVESHNEYSQSTIAREVMNPAFRLMKISRCCCFHNLYECSEDCGMKSQSPLLPPLLLTQ